MATATRTAGTAAKPADAQRAQRPVCGQCGAPLTSYNPGPNCFAHTLAVPWKGPGVRLR